MSAQHTSLPWALESIPDLEDGENIEIYDSDGFPIARIEGEPIINKWPERFPEMDHWSDGKEDGRTVKERPAAEILANARLISAAPELLAACEAQATLIRDLLKLIVTGALTDVQKSQLIAVSDQVCEALDKARGEK